jgi:hypothetical protein
LFVGDIPKTRNAKVMRRIVRAAYLGEKPGTPPRWKTQRRWMKSSAQRSDADNPVRERLEADKIVCVTLVPESAGNWSCFGGASSLPCHSAGFGMAHPTNSATQLTTRSFAVARTAVIRAYDEAGNVIERHESHRRLLVFRELNLAVSVEGM